MKLFERLPSWVQWIAFVVFGVAVLFLAVDAEWRKVCLLYPEVFHCD